MIEYISKGLAWHYIKLTMPTSEREKLVEAFNKIPTADVKPIVRGEWVVNNNLGECSICGEIVKEKFNFCSHCGADMRGDK